MRLEEGRVIVDEIENKRIKALTGDTVPDTGMTPRELKTKIDNALASGRKRSPGKDIFWDRAEKSLKDINRFVALH
jgi:hypothetical protein